MDIDKKTILAFVLIGLILILTQTSYYKRMVLPPRKVKTPEEVAPQKELSPTEGAQEQPAPKVESERVEAKAEVEEKETEKTQVQEFEPLKRGQGQEIIVETDLYWAILSTKGATIVSWTLKDFLAPDSTNVQMIPEDSHGNLGLLFTINEETIDTSPFVFTVNQTELFLNDEKGTATLSFELDMKDGRRIRKEFTFYNDKYSFDLRTELINLGSVISDREYQLVWESGLESTEANLNEDMRYSKAYALLGDQLKDFDVKNEKEELTGNVNWAAVRTKYFTMAIIPVERKGLGVKFYGEGIPVEKDKHWKWYSIGVKMPFYEETERHRFTIYLGPLDYDIMKAYGVGLEKMMSLGWKIIRPFSIAALWTFKKLHAVIPNYGWVIIVFSILIKIVLYPLTRKSYASMKHMQALQPKLAELKQKYGKDPQRLNRETMKLYKEHGVNPMGGCLPMLLQMPLLIALFTIFRSTIELRGAKFFWWIKDLSAPDTVATLPFSIPFYGNLVNILPLFMGATMLIQQKMTMKDPKQKAMVYLMPIFFTLLFNSFPSGLNLYYSLFNLFTIIQQKLIPDSHEKEGAVEEQPVKVKKRPAKPVAKKG